MSDNWQSTGKLVNEIVAFHQKSQFYLYSPKNDKVRKHKI